MIAGAASVALVLGGAGAAQAGPVAPPVVGYTYAGFVVPTAAQNGGAAYVPVQGLVSGAGATFSLSSYGTRMLCGGTTFYPLDLTTYGGGSFSFSGLVPVSESGHTCVVNVYSAVSNQTIDFQPGQVSYAGDLLPTAVVNIYCEIVNHSNRTGGL
ncbi:hypothetical protein B7R25_06020 [Subtercola boreus]|uniref:Uncharacterized protein n=2 Tax=Subtercola boreus TaxID=120213 RepID=A0A3E0WC47_9MICO|nr:hypothetical protein B7R24_05950 [Subtercola boreus]RFA27881.1 hypothetical protein B7R25_06020 [Subtercola boreus]